MTPDELTYLASFFLKPLVGGAAEKAKKLLQYYAAWFQSRFGGKMLPS